jgi:hypothetical protein
LCFFFLNHIKYGNSHLRLAFVSFLVDSVYRSTYSCPLISIYFIVYITVTLIRSNNILTMIMCDVMNIKKTALEYVPHSPCGYANWTFRLQYSILFYSIPFYSFTALQPFVGPWPLFQFLNLYSIGRIPWTVDKPVASPLPTHRTTQTQNKSKQTSTPRVEFEPTTQMFERAKTVHALDSAAIGCNIVL